MDIKSDFPIYDYNKDLVYFDSTATSLKPKCVIDAMNDYYTKYTSNSHRGDYKNSTITNERFENTRVKVSELINAKQKEEIIFTSGTTHSLNQIVFGFMVNYLTSGDEVLLTTSEHASNVLPWFSLKKDKDININYIPLVNKTIDLKELENCITPRTKVISIAHITNTIGDKRDIEAISKIAKKHGILLVVDAAQSAGHTIIDVTTMDIDFLTFSGHKMMGPTGIGVLYAKYEHLEKMTPLMLGGGMNNTFEKSCDYSYKSVPYKFEAGTQNIAGVIGLGAALEYINKLGISNIENHITTLKEYIVSNIKDQSNIELYNEDVDGSIILFNIKDVFPQDAAIYLDKFNICVRAGNHCAKMLLDDIGVKNTCRLSLYAYNDIDDVNRFIEVIKNTTKDKVYSSIL